MHWTEIKESVPKKFVHDCRYNQVVVCILQVNYKEMVNLFHCRSDNYLSQMSNEPRSFWVNQTKRYQVYAASLVTTMGNLLLTRVKIAQGYTCLAIQLFIDCKFWILSTHSGFL